MIVVLRWLQLLLWRRCAPSLPSGLIALIRCDKDAYELSNQPMLKIMWMIVAASSDNLISRVI
jgi:hypothetical protein